MSSHSEVRLIALVPAAGVGSRMQADMPKQYLKIDHKTILEHTVHRLLEHQRVDAVVVVIAKDDPYFYDLELNRDPRIICVEGGKERADSVLSGLQYIQQHQLASWVMVHDAARPCVRLSDIDKLIDGVMTHPVGGILAAPVRDTMKRSDTRSHITHTVEREALWHALTPQLFPVETLLNSLQRALNEQVVITDEASALEWAGYQPLLVAGAADNIKITQPEDLALAEFYLKKDKQG